MKNLEKPQIEIVRFECNDIITTSLDHDNGFIGGGTLPYVINDLKNLIKQFYYLNR